MIRMLTGNEQINQVPTEVLRVVSPLLLNTPLAYCQFLIYFFLCLCISFWDAQGHFSRIPEASQTFSIHAGLHTGFPGTKWNQTYVAHLAAFFLITTIVRPQSTGMGNGWLEVKTVTETLQNSSKKFNQHTLYISITAAYMIYFCLQILLVANSVN